MDRKKIIQEFLEKLTKVTLETGVVLSACGCCGGIGGELPNDLEWIDNIQWDREKKIYTCRE